MADNLQELDGVGPSREESLNDAGYEEYSDIADADQEQLSDEISRLPEDTALELIVQAENIVAEQQAQVVEEEPEPPEQLEEVDDDDDDDEAVKEDTADDADDEEQQVSFELTFETALQYDTFYNTLNRHRANIEQTNRVGAGLYTNLLENVRGTEIGETASFELSPDELNNLHSAILQRRIDYQGNNLIDHMDALQQIENKIDEVRENELF